MATRSLVEEGAESLANPAFEKATGRILIVRLSPWTDVDRSSSHLVLFSETRKALPGAFIDFAFFPGRHDRDLLAAGDFPWFHGIASGRGPDHFDLVMVSNAFGLELVNLPWLFSTAHLPLGSVARAKLDNAPLVILGGSNASACGPLVGADDAMVDGLFFGEGEGAIGPLAAILVRPEGSRAQRLAKAEGIAGFKAFGAAMGDSIVVSRTLPCAPPATGGLPLLNSPESSTVRLQISAGCPGLCSFCFEGWDRRPYREVPFADIIASARELRRSTGADSLEVYSFNFNTHSEIALLIFELGRVFRRVNLMSQRLDILAAMPALLKAELAADKRSFTLGIEGISQRMRALYRKGLSEEGLERLESLLVVPGVKELKLFYIVSGFESQADIAEFRAFMEHLSAERGDRAPGLKILASAGYLVRLPRTPLQYAPLALEEKQLRLIADALRECCDAAGVEFRLAAHFDEYCADQLLSLGDGRLLPWLGSVPAKGHVYDGSLSRAAWPSLKDAALASGLLSAAFLDEKPDTYRGGLPFLTADSAVLHREYIAAKAFLDREACLGEGCSGCGACPDPGSASFIGKHVIRLPDTVLIDRIMRLESAKRAFAPVFVEAVIPEGLAGATTAYLEAWLSRSLLASAPDSELSLFACREMLFSPGDFLGLGEGFTGKAVFGLFGPSKERLCALAAGCGLHILDCLPAPRKVRVRIGIPWGEAETLESFREWLAFSHVTGTESRMAIGRRFVVSTRDKRKAVIHEADFTWEKDSAAIDAVLGQKARLSDWFRICEKKRAPGALGFLPRVRVESL